MSSGHINAMCHDANREVTLCIYGIHDNQTSQHKFVLGVFSSEFGHNLIIFTVLHGPISIGESQSLSCGYVVYFNLSDIFKTSDLTRIIKKDSNPTSFWVQKKKCTFYHSLHVVLASYMYLKHFKSIVYHFFKGKMHK